MLVDDMKYKTVRMKNPRDVNEPQGARQTCKRWEHKCTDDLENTAQIFGF